MKQRKQVVKKGTKIVVGDFVLEADSVVSSVGQYSNLEGGSMVVKFKNGKSETYYDDDLVVVNTLIN